MSQGWGRAELRACPRRAGGDPNSEPALGGLEERQTQSLPQDSNVVLERHSAGQHAILETCPSQAADPWITPWPTAALRPTLIE